MSPSKTEIVNFWQAYANGLEPCSIDLACGDPSSGDCRHLTKIPPGGGLDRLRGFCDATGKSPSNVLKAAWAMVLRVYAATEIGIFEFVEGSLVAEHGTENAGACPASLTSLVRFQLGNDMNCGDIVDYMEEDHSGTSSFRAPGLGPALGAKSGSNMLLYNTRLAVWKAVDIGFSTGTIGSLDTTESQVRSCLVFRF